MSQSDPSVEVARALAGDPRALSALVARLTPVIHARVARGLLLWRTGGAASRSVRQEVEDFVQEMFLVLFVEEGRVLRGWDAARGLSLENYVGLVVERRLTSILRTGKRNPWTEEPTAADELEQIPSAEATERAAESREVLGHLLGRLREELTPLGWRLFQLLFVEERDPPEVMAATGLSADAVYAWRSRLKRLAARLLASMSDGPVDGRNNSQGRVS
jgi:RNA polymerase sigma-70 factor (ECF subfamily)